MRERAEAATEGPWEETWKAIPGYDGYEVSDFGNVRSYYLKGNHKRKRAEFPRLLRLRGERYPSVQLPVDGTYRNRAVHRLVMLAFFGPCPEGFEVAHLNGDNTDNRLVNLAYVSHVENESHKVAHGTSSAGEGNSNAALQGWQVAEIKFLAAKSIPQGRIADLFEISHKQVDDILRERSWADTPVRTDVPALVGALEAVLARHQQRLNTVSALYPKPLCTCEHEYPCPTVQAIETALEGR
jgi:hypothetical protein